MRAVVARQAVWQRPPFVVVHARSLHERYRRPTRKREPGAFTDGVDAGQQLDRTRQRRAVDNARAYRSDLFRNLDGDRAVKLHRRLVGEPRRHRLGERCLIGVMNERDEDQRWHPNGDHFHPVLERLHEGDAAHATDRHVDRDDGANHDDANPIGRTSDDRQGEARPFHLR